MSTKFWKEKIIAPKNLAKVIREIKLEKKKIASINGSFDLLHAGHLYILSEAAKRGDVLIVALNSDDSIKQYKDPKRPIIPLNYRLQMMAAIAFVDFVTWFEEVDPCNILKCIKPNVHINDTEYGRECIEAEVVKEGGGVLHLIEKIDGLSTSAILEKIRSCGF